MSVCSGIGGPLSHTEVYVCVFVCVCADTACALNAVSCVCMCTYRLHFVSQCFVCVCDIIRYTLSQREVCVWRGACALIGYALSHTELCV